MLLNISAISTPAKKLWGASECKSTSENQAVEVQSSQLANPIQVTLLRSFRANQASSFSVGAYPYGIAFDGSNIWVTNNGSNTVTKLKAGDGSLVGTYAVGIEPWGIVLGSSIRVTNSGDSTVTKLNASDGALVGTYAVTGGAQAVAFGGTNIWVTNIELSTVTKLNAGNPSLALTCSREGSWRRF